MKYRVGNSGNIIKMDGDWLILDIGSGHNPHPRADVLLDREIGCSIHRSGKSIKIGAQKSFILGDTLHLPFKSKSFNFIIASHIAEHVNDPQKFCEEIIRVGRGGYIECPSKLCEKLLGEPYHKWFVYRKRNSLYFERKLRTTGIPRFYNLYYYGEKREGHKMRETSNIFIHGLLRLIAFFLRRIWLLGRKINYTCFEWKNSFTFRIINSSEDEQK